MHACLPRIVFRGQLPYRFGRIPINIRTLQELRFQDYQQGRKTAGAFGQTAFGGTQPQTQSTGLFGSGAANTAAPAGGLFGSSNAFGNTNTVNTGPTGGFGAFGSTPSTTQPGTSSLFGGGTFGQPQQQQQQQPQPQPATTGAFGTFGQPQQQPQQQQAGLFGGATFGGTPNQQKPAFGSFGASLFPLILSLFLTHYPKLSH